MELKESAKQFAEYIGAKDTGAFAALVIAGFSGILVGAVFLIIGLLVVDSIDGAIGILNGTMNTTQTSIMTSIGQAFTIGGVALIVVGVAVIVAVLFGMVGGGGRAR